MALERKKGINILKYFWPSANAYFSFERLETIFSFLCETITNRKKTYIDDADAMLLD